MRNLQTTFVFSGALLLAGCGLGWLMGLSTTPVVAGVITALMTSAAAILGALGGVQSESGAAPSADAGAEGGLPPWNTRINPLPLAFLALGIVVGSIFGIRARNLNWLGSDVANELQKWTNAGLAKEDVAQRLFENSFPAQGYSGSPVWAIRDAAQISQTLATEVGMWDALGLDRKQVAQKLFDLRYPAASSTTPRELGKLTPTSTTASVLFEAWATACDESLGYDSRDLRNWMINVSGVVEFAEFAKANDDPQKLKAFVERLCGRN
jgi:hypothetical protein